MKRFIILAAFVLTGLSAATAQTQQTQTRRIRTKAEQQRAADREIRRREQAAQDSLDYRKAVRSLENLEFALEADQLALPRGRMVAVSTTTNFLMLNDERATVQIASYTGGGPNGVGGITLDGRATDIELKVDKKGTTYLSMAVSGTGISASVAITLPKGGNRASVTISPNFNSNRMTLYGRLIPLDESRVFKGLAL